MLYQNISYYKELSSQYSQQLNLANVSTSTSKDCCYITMAIRVKNIAAPCLVDLVKVKIAVGLIQRRHLTLFFCFF